MVRLLMCIIGLSVFLMLCGCSPFRDVADSVSDEFGEISDDIGKKRVLGEDDADGVVIYPQGDKKIKMEF